MAKNPKSLLHAEHNEKVCKHLDKSPDYLDWVITTSFYSALHYLKYKIFPFKVTFESGKYTFKDFDEYSLFYKSRNLNRHSLLLELAQNKCPEIHDKYNWLKDVCWTARYNDYTADRTLSNAAKKRLEEIKEYCIS